MVTVSDVKFFSDREGKCPECGREPVMLGRMNIVGMAFRPLRCIDCCFGPPYYLWDNCPQCGWWQPGWKCDKCGEVIRGEES